MLADCVMAGTAGSSADGANDASSVVLCDSNSTSSAAPSVVGHGTLFEPFDASVVDVVGDGNAKTQLKTIFAQTISGQSNCNDNS